LKAYLVRHARPVDASVDPDRPLSAEGVSEIVKIADHLLDLGDVCPEVIVHSGKTRAKQTAEILASKLGPPSGVVEESGLSPGDPVTGWDAYLEMHPGSMLVGHMPFLELLSCELTKGGACEWNMEFRTAEVSCYECIGEAEWELVWHIAPDDI
jgi:phosphohistidine phosphatase